MYWYVNGGNGTTTGWYAVTRWAATTAKTVGQTVRPFTTPTIYSERVYVCIIAGTTAAVEPTWIITTGAKTVDGGVTWMECSGRPGVNGSLPYTITWNINDPALVGTVALGTQVNGVTGGSATTLFICTTSGTIGAVQPTWNLTVGGNTTDGSVVWTCLGPVANYAAWANPLNRLGTLLHPTATTRTTPNDIIFVGDNHTETGGGSNTICMIALPPSHTYCVDHTVATPTGANLKNTAVLNSNTLIVIYGNGYINGINFTTTFGTVVSKFQLGQANGNMTLENCTFTVNGTFTAGTNNTSINLGQANTLIEYITLINCSVYFSDPTSCIAMIGGSTHWKNTVPLLMPGSTVPTALVSGTANVPNNYYATLIFEGVDFTGINTTLIDNLAQGSKISLIKCKLDPAGAIYQAGSLVEGNLEVEVSNCDSGAAYYRNEKLNGLGWVRTNTANYRVGGATDGVTPISWFTSTTPYCCFDSPFIFFPISVYNTTVGTPITATIETVCVISMANGIAGMWLDASYLGTAGSTLRSFASTGTNGIDIGTTWPTSTATWVSPSLPTPVKQYMSITITPQAAGLIFFYIKISRASAGGLYIDPKVTFS